MERTAPNSAQAALSAMDAQTCAFVARGRTDATLCRADVIANQALPAQCATNFVKLGAGVKIVSKDAPVEMGECAIPK